MRFEKIAAVCRRPRTQGVFQIVHHDGERHHVGKNTHKIKYGRLPNQHDKIVKAISAANVLLQHQAIQGDDWLPRGELPIQPEKLTTKWKGASIMFVTVPTGSVEPASDIS